MDDKKQTIKKLIMTLKSIRQKKQNFLDRCAAHGLKVRMVRIDFGPKKKGKYQVFISP